MDSKNYTYQARKFRLQSRHLDQLLHRDLQGLGAALERAVVQQVQEVEQGAVEGVGERLHLARAQQARVQLWIAIIRGIFVLKTNNVN